MFAGLSQRLVTWPTCCLFFRDLQERPHGMLLVHNCSSMFLHDLLAPQPQPTLQAPTPNPTANPEPPGCFKKGIFAVSQDIAAAFPSYPLPTVTLGMESQQHLPLVPADPPPSVPITPPPTLATLICILLSTMPRSLLPQDLCTRCSQAENTPPPPHTHTVFSLSLKLDLHGTSSLRPQPHTLPCCPSTDHVTSSCLLVRPTLLLELASLEQGPRRSGLSVAASLFRGQHGLLLE